MFRQRITACIATACLTGLILTASFQTAHAQPEATPDAAATTAQPPAKPVAPTAKPAAQPKPAPPATPADGKAPPATEKLKEDKPPVKPAPPAVRPLDSPLSPFSNLQMPAGRRPFLSRLSRTPDLFGDFNTLSVAQIGGSFMDDVVSVPGGGAVRRYKNEQARALPTDRAFVFFNHFHNALEISDFSGNRSDDINQFTFGAEKTFGDGDWSVEIRLPLATESDLATEFNHVQSDGLGNLVVTLKKLLYADSAVAAALGLAVTAPTGDNANIEFSGTFVTIENEAVHLLPYFALQVAPDDNWFFHAFAQVDVAANGDGVQYVAGQFVDTGRIVEQTLMFLDVSAGYWWMRTDVPDASGLTGLASVIELHYTTALNDAHTTEVGFLTVGNLDNRIDVLNLTLGLHSEWKGDTAVRLATVVPLRRSSENRFFDTEIQLAIIKRL